jgi:hypothetical protein
MTAIFLMVALAGLDLPKEPLNLLPFAVFLSPLPIIECVIDYVNNDCGCKNAEILAIKRYKLKNPAVGGAFYTLLLLIIT